MIVTLPSPHPEALARPSTPKVRELGSVPQFLILPLFSHLDSQLSLLKNLGVRHTTIATLAPQVIVILNLEKKVEIIPQPIVEDNRN